MNQDMTNVIMAISAAVTALATVALVIFAMVQWKKARDAILEASRSRSAQVLLKIYDILVELRPHWHKLYRLPENHADWSEEQRAIADHVGVGLQRVAFLCEKKFVDYEFVMDGYAKVFVQCWRILKPFIQDYRSLGGEETEVALGGYQRKHLEIFAWRCEQYLKKLMKE